MIFSLHFYFKFNFTLNMFYCLYYSGIFLLMEYNLQSRNLVIYVLTSFKILTYYILECFNIEPS